MKKNVMIFLLLGMFFISFTGVSAGNFANLQIECSAISPAQQDNAKALWQTCDSCTYVNISSVILPNGTIESYNVAMTKVGTTYTYSYTPTLIGKYYYSVVGDKNGILDEETLCFESTYTGEGVSTSQSIVLIAQLGIMALLFGFGRIFDNKKWKIKMFFDMMATLMCMILINSVKIVSSQSFKLNQMGEAMFYIGFVLVGFLFLYLFINATLELINYFKDKKDKKWGNAGYDD
jgi:hypothetical protein